MLHIPLHSSVSVIGSHVQVYKCKSPLYAPALLYVYDNNKILNIEFSAHDAPLEQHLIGTSTIKKNWKAK